MGAKVKRTFGIVKSLVTRDVIYNFWRWLVAFAFCMVSMERRRSKVFLEGDVIFLEPLDLSFHFSLNLFPIFKFRAKIFL